MPGSAEPVTIASLADVEGVPREEGDSANREDHGPSVRGDRDLIAEARCRLPVAEHDRRLPARFLDEPFDRVAKLLRGRFPLARIVPADYISSSMPHWPPGAVCGS